MDMIREEYDQDMFIYLGAEPSIRVRWYRAHPNAEPARPYTIFGSSARSSLKFVPVGEKWDLNTYKRGSWGNYGGYLGKNICGPPGWWYNGAEVSDPIPPCTCEKEVIVPVQEVPAGVIDGMNRDFTLSKPPISNASVLIWVNGVKNTEGKDYSLTGQAIRFTGGAQPRPGVDNVFSCMYWIFT